MGPICLILAGTVRGPSRGRQQTESYIVQDDVRTARLSARYEDLTAILSGRPCALSALSLFTHITGPASLNTRVVCLATGHVCSVRVFSLFGCRLYAYTTHQDEAL